MRNSPKPTTDEPKTPSLGKAFLISIESVQKVSEDASRTEAKIVGLFATASTIVGISAALSTSLVGSKVYWPNLLFYLAVVAYFWVVAWTYRGLRGRVFYEPPDPQILREQYWTLGEDEFMRKLYGFAEQHYAEHEKHLRAKASSLRMTLPGLVIEVTFLLAWAFFRAAFPIS